MDSDTDGDGLLDVYEIKGVRIQNATIVKTKPNEKDSDNDGINDFVELGGNPKEVVIDKMIRYVNYQKSNPNVFNSREPMPGYMIVDDFDYLPYDQENYDKIFVDDTGEKDSEGNTIYGLYNLYNSNENALRLKEKYDIHFKAEMQCILLSAKEDLLPEAVEFLQLYLDNETERNFYDCSRILKHSEKARDAWAEVTYHIMSAAEDYLEEGETIILTQKPDNQSVGIMFDVNFLDFSLEDFNAHVAVNSAKARSVAQISFDGKKYNMKYRFYIFDYYDWDPNDFRKVGFVYPAQLYKLCKCGTARFYENWGVYETELSWEATAENRQEVLIQEKEKMKKTNN